MKNIYVIMITILLLCTVLQSNCLADNKQENIKNITPAQYEKGYRYNIQGWVYLHIEGEPYERGYQYGYLASAEIIDMIQRWSNLAHSFSFMKVFILKNQPENYDEISEKWWNICRSESMKKFFNQVPEEYKQEMQGMTDGLKDRDVKIFGRNIEFEDVVASQFVQDVQYTISKFNKGIHPLRSFLNGLKDLFTGEILKYDGHCHIFIATGDATSNGGIVVAHETVFSPYIAQRCNFIVDVQPSNGNRFLMTCPPGSLWSQEDWYQNDKGIIITETELTPQGPWKIRGNAPKGVRSRTAIQYSDSIDEVIENLKNGNSGLIPNEWIIGDRKTGEIASYQQALYNTPIKRTFNGYYQSNCFPQNINVLSELTGLPKFVLKTYSKIFSKNAFFNIEGENVIWNEEVYQKLKEMGEKYYGKIDENIAKEIMSTDPVTKRTTDCKITTSKLMENLGMHLYMGIVNGTTLIPSKDEKEKLKGITKLPPCGWVTIYPHNVKDQKISKILTTSHVVNDNTEYFGSWDGNIYSLDSDTGDINWKYQTNWGVVTTPAISDGLVFAGSLDNNFYAINKETGELDWSFICKSAIHSSPVVYGEYVFFGCDDGKLYALNKTNGDFAWSFAPEYTIEENGVNNYITTPITSDPFVKDGFVHIDVNGKTYELDPQTEEKEEATVKEKEGYNEFSIFVFLTWFGIFLLLISLIIHLYNKKKDVK